MPDDDEAQEKAAREREGLEEWLRANRAESARRDLADAAPEAHRLTASDTQIEAIDRAAHTPAWHDYDNDARANFRAAFSEDDMRHIEEMQRDYAELYPTEADEMRWTARPDRAPVDQDERQQYYDLMDLFPEWGEGLRERKERAVTPEQKERVDRALADVELSDTIGTAEASDYPRPNDPTPVDKTIDIGHDLHRSGVTMDK